MQISVEKALEKLDREDQPFVALFSHGSLSVEFYKPVDKDWQEPHSRDEMYVVASGSGTFLHGEQRSTFKSGDFLFVPAGVVHCFEDFSDDFGT